MKGYWIESNVAASNGDKVNEDPDDEPEVVLETNFAIPIEMPKVGNPAFKLWGIECYNLWLAAAKDQKGYLYEEKIENFKKIYPVEGKEFKYEKEQAT